MTRLWTLVLRGGCYDGLSFPADTPGPLVIAWRCSKRCDGHATFDAEDPAIVIATAVAYRLAETDDTNMVAVYDVGADEPEIVEERERELLVPSGLAETIAMGRALAVALPAGLLMWGLLIPLLLRGRL